MNEAERKLHSAAGLTRAAAVLLALILALLASFLVPAVRHYQSSAAATACNIAMAEAQRRVDTAVPLSGGALRPSEARYAAAGGGDVTDWERRFETLCPSGGDVALLRVGEGYRVVCALHTSDHAARTRLNAYSAEEQLAGALEASASRGEAPDETVTVTLNGKPFSITRATEEPEIGRGTGSTPGYRGVVAYYGAAEDGSLRWFCYADEEHCAFFRRDEGWRYDPESYPIPRGAPTP